MSTTPTDQFPQLLKLTYDTEENAWGDIVNTNFEVLARAIGGFISVDCTGGSDVVLTEDQYSNRVISLAGTLSASINVIVPSFERTFVVRNGCTGVDGSGNDFQVTVKTSGGSGLSFPCNKSARLLCYCDGVNVVSALNSLDCNHIGLFRNFQSAGINDAATATVLTLTAGGRMLLAANTPLTLSGGTLEYVRTSASDIDHSFFDEASDTVYFVAGGSSKTTDPTKAANAVFKNLTLVNGGDLTAAGDGSFGGNLAVAGAADVTGTLHVGGNVQMDLNLVVSGLISADNLGSASQAESSDFALASHDHADATASADGYMSAADKIKLDALPLKLLHCRDEKTSGTDGGDLLSGSTYGRLCDDVETNEITGASVTLDEITLPAGTYYIEASVPGHAVNSHRAQLYNQTALTVLIYGTTEFAGSDNVQSSSLINGLFTLTEQSVIKVLHRCSATKLGNGRGVAAGFGTVEVYTEVKIWKRP